MFYSFLILFVIKIKLFRNHANMLKVPIYNMQKVWYRANRDIICNIMIRIRKINFKFIYLNWHISHSTKKFIDQSHENRYYDVWIKPIEKTSVADPWHFGHFGVGPDPDLNSRIHASDKWIRKSKIRHKAVGIKVFLFFLLVDSDPQHWKNQ